MKSKDWCVGIKVYWVSLAATELKMGYRLEIETSDTVMAAVVKVEVGMDLTRLAITGDWGSRCW
jgi:hypothetical protein